MSLITNKYIMGKLTTEEIIVLDKIIEKLDETNLNGNAILEICGDNVMAETACRILEDEGWICTTRVDQQNYPIDIWKSDSYRMLLARKGNYAEQAKAEEQRFQQIAINATSSNIAVENTSSVIQTINNNEVIELIQKLIQETERNNDIIPEEKEDIIELLMDLNNSIKQGNEPPKSVLKRLAYYGEKVINIGASILTILSILKG